MKVPLPQPLAQRVADKAVSYARMDMQSKGWKSARGISPIAQEGLVGIKTSVRYLMYQEKGIKPFLMKWVDGRTIPMGCKMGDGPHFRRGGHVGEPGYVDIPHKGRVWRNQRWRHPGIKGNKFMENAINRAVSEIKRDLKQDVMTALRGEYH